MARRSRIDYPTNVSDMATREYLERVADVLNQLPNISIISEASGPNSRYSGNYGDLAVNVAAGQGELHIKSSGEGNTTTWKEIGGGGGYGSLYNTDPGPGERLFSSTPSLYTGYQGVVVSAPVSVYSNPANIQQLAGFTISSTGTYMFGATSSFTADVNTEWGVHLYCDESETSYGFHRQIGASSDIGSAGFVGGIVHVTAGQNYSLYVASDGASDGLSVIDLSFFVYQLE